MNGTPRWPDGAQCAVTVTVNFDAESVERQTMPGPLWGRYAYGRYGAQVGIHRFLDLFERHGVRATIFIPGWDAERYPEVMERIARSGHEVAGHGYLHEDFSRLNADEQGSVLAKSEAAFERVFGRKPAGWRAPDGLMSADTRAILAARGYRYDSSYCDDDYPYVATEGGRPIAELPVFATASDRHYYGVRRFPTAVERAWHEEFSAVYAIGGLFNLTLHPRGDYGSGRSVRLRAVEALLQLVREHPRIWLATCADVADRVLATTG